MSSLIKIHYIGQRKDGGKGAIWGYFTEVGKHDSPLYNYYTRSYDLIFCHVFWGRLGKTLHIEQRHLTGDFMSEVDAKKKNFKEVEKEKILTKWGKDFNEELSMYLLMLKIKG